MILPYPAQFPTKNRNIGSFTQDRCNNPLPSTIQIQSINTEGFLQYAGCLTVHSETQAVGMYKEVHQRGSPEIGI